MDVVFDSRLCIAVSRVVRRGFKSHVPDYCPQLSSSEAILAGRVVVSRSKACLERHL